MRYLLSVIVVFLLGVHSLPYIIKDQVLIWLKQQGVTAPSFKSISINYLSAQITLNKLQANELGKPNLEVGEVTIVLNYKNLFDDKLLIEQFIVKDVDLGVKKIKGNLFVGPININQFDAKEETTQKETEPASSWQFGLRAMRFENLTFNVDVAPFKQQLNIHSAFLKDIYQWQAQAKTALDIEGLINSAPFTISTIATVFPEEKKSQLEFQLKDFVLESVTAPIIPQLKAIVNTDLSITVDLKNLTGKITHKGRFNLSAVAWEDEQQQLKLDDLNWTGQGQLSLDNAKPSAADIEGKLSLKKMLLNKPKQKESVIQLSAFNWQGPLKTTFKDGKIQQLLVSDDFSIADLNVNLDKTKVSIKQLKSSTGGAPILLDFKQQLLKQIKLTNTLEIQQLALKLAQQSLKLTKATLSHKQPLSISLNDKGLQAIAAVPTLSLSGLNFSQPKLSLSANALSLKGPVSISNVSTTPILSSTPSVSGSSVKLNIDKNLSVTNGAISLSAKLSKMKLNKPNISGINLNISDFTLASRTHALNVAAFKKLSLNNAAYSTKLISLDKLNISALKIASQAKSKPLTRVSQLSINRLKLANLNQLAIGSIAVSNTNSQIFIAQSGELPLLAKLQKAFAGDKKTVSKPKSKSAKSPFNYAIKNISITGNNKILFEDQSVEPWFKSTLDISKLSLSNIYSQSANSVPINLNAKINDNTLVTLKADVTPFTASKTGQWALTLDGLSMPVISPYSGKFSGYFLDSGKLSVVSNGVIKKNVLKGKNKVNIQQLSVRSAQSDATSKTNSSLNMPLDVAISVLEDDNGDIKLSVPVSGSMDDPNFGYSSVLEIIAKKGLKKAAFGILTKALQPYGALITIATTAIDAKENGTFINLAPVNFVAGKDTVSSDMKKYLRKIAKMMKKRKKLKLKVCAIGVAQDHAIIAPTTTKQNALLEKPLGAKQLIKTIKNQVQALATQRGKNVVKELKRLNVKDNRLFVCFAKTNFKKKKLKPIVSLGL